jgi:hypothetical protein
MKIRPIKFEYNITTGRETITELTQQEIDDLGSKEIELADEQARSMEVRESAINKLKLIGLTDEEIATLLG